ncbi:hypothetical protein HCN44_008473 [Aphidius gifuensis]|uniref:F-box only protein 28 n=1 Tax=Aphidius gifuensis TaxID=684658 RepID=A0A834XR92_APHGI|nr:F-box only protein 28 [Aphidius gifuensis]KAF7989799.1 hypothetical protein HCN44_008473 [Aphidius gifuensis]
MRQLLLIELTDVVLEHILGFLSYDEIAKNRIICKQFDRTCQKLLNRGFSLMEKYHAQCYRSVKGQLPRRESERRNHRLSRHSDILSALETRISMMSMTFIKYVNMRICCFIPGKVIDEAFRVLRMLMETRNAPRAHEVLQELRDISSMAMEHFDEKILPELKSNLSTISTSYELPGRSNSILSHHNPSTSSTSHTFNQINSLTPDKLNQTINKAYNRAKKNKIMCFNTNNRVMKIRLRLKRQSIQMRLQSKKLQEQSKKIHEQELQLTEMRRTLTEWEQKMGDMTAEYLRAREDTQQNGIIKPIDNNNAVTTKQLQAKKRKLIVERKSSTHAADDKFKKFMSDLLKPSDSVSTV